MRRAAPNARNGRPPPMLLARTRPASRSLDRSTAARWHSSHVTTLFRLTSTLTTLGTTLGSHHSSRPTALTCTRQRSSSSCGALRLYVRRAASSQRAHTPPRPPPIGGAETRSAKRLRAFETSRCRTAACSRYASHDTQRAAAQGALSALRTSTHERWRTRKAGGANMTILSKHRRAREGPPRTKAAEAFGVGSNEPLCRHRRHRHSWPMATTGC
jgi:hypothetical protein